MLRLRVCGQMFSALPVDLYLGPQQEAYRTDDKKGEVHCLTVTPPETASGERGILRQNVRYPGICSLWI